MSAPRGPRAIEDEVPLWQEYYAAAEDLYGSLGMAAHGETREIVAFVTKGTVAAMERMNRAALAICAARGEVARPGAAS